MDNIFYAVISFLRKLTYYSEFRDKIMLELTAEKTERIISKTISLAPVDFFNVCTFLCTYV